MDRLKALGIAVRKGMRQRHAARDGKNQDELRDDVYGPHDIISISLIGSVD